MSTGTLNMWIDDITWASLPSRSALRSLIPVSMSSMMCYVALNATVSPH